MNHTFVGFAGACRVFGVGQKCVAAALFAAVAAAAAAVAVFFSSVFFIGIHYCCSLLTLTKPLQMLRNWPLPGRPNSNEHS